MKPAVYEAIRRFEIEIKQVIPGAEAKVIETFDDADASLLVKLPDIEIGTIEKMVDLVLKIEEETGVTLSTMPTTNESEAKSRKSEEVRKG